MSTIYSDGIKVEFAGTVLRQRDDGLYWLTAEHETIGYGQTVGLYLCRKTAKADTYEWLSFRDTGYKFLTLADASEAATALESDSRIPAKSLDARHAD